MTSWKVRDKKLEVQVILVTGVLEREIRENKGGENFQR